MPFRKVNTKGDRQGERLHIPSVAPITAVDMYRSKQTRTNMIAVRVNVAKIFQNARRQNEQLG